MDTKAAFEKWWKEEHGNLQDTGFIGQTIKMVAQQAWTASRAAIDISPVEEYSDSPLDIIYEQPDGLSRDGVTQFGYMRGYNDCINNLSNSQGLTIKK